MNKLRNTCTILVEDLDRRMTLCNVNMDDRTILKWRKGDNWELNSADSDMG
jgi:hypothetical protein